MSAGTGWAWAFYTHQYLQLAFGLAPCYLKRMCSGQSKPSTLALLAMTFALFGTSTPLVGACMDAGKSSKTVPFDKITDCDIEEPAGNTCIVIRNVLTTVNIDTASSGQRRSELKMLAWRIPKSLSNRFGRWSVASISQAGQQLSKWWTEEEHLLLEKVLPFCCVRFVLNCINIIICFSRCAEASAKCTNGGGSSLTHVDYVM